MKFFDKKEEVLDIQLTRYGRKQMSKGGLKPKYYAFFDDNILYDTEYAGFDEDQNSAEPRIQEETVNLKTQAIFESTDFKNKNLQKDQSTADRHYSLTSRLGNSSLNSDFRPSWEVRFLAGEMSGSSPFMTGSHQPLKIPQLNVDLIYTTTVHSSNDETAGNEFEYAPEDFLPEGDKDLLTSTFFPDGTFLAVEQDMVLLDIFEENTEFEADNVMVEVFEVELVNVSGSIQNLGASTSMRTKKEVLKPLKFVKETNPVQDNLLVPQSELRQNIVAVDPSYVEYYFDLLTDSSIPNDIFCAGVKNLRSKGVDIDYAICDCPETPANKEGVNVYATDMTAEDITDCED